MKAEHKQSTSSLLQFSFCLSSVLLEVKRTLRLARPFRQTERSSSSFSGRLPSELLIEVFSDGLRHLHNLYTYFLTVFLDQLDSFK